MARRWVWLIHGFNVADQGQGTIERLRYYLSGVSLRLSYPWTFLLSLRVRNRWLAEFLVSEHRSGDSVVAHSNGCVIALMAAQRGAMFETLVLINPALNARTEFPSQLRAVHVLHAENDRAVTAGKWWRRLNPVSWLFRHPWGEMGRIGYQGNDPRVTNHSLGRIGHSGVFSRLEEWGPRINAMLEASHAR